MGFDSHLLDLIPEESSYETLSTAESSILYQLFNTISFVVFKWFNPVGVTTLHVKTKSKNLQEI